MVISPKLAQFIKKDGTSEVLIYIYDPKTRAQAKVGTNIYVPYTEWTGSNVDRKRPNAQFLNTNIKRIQFDIETYSSQNPQLSPNELKKWYKGPKIKFTPVTYFRHYIELCKKGDVVKKLTKEKMSLGYIKALGTSATHLEKFAKENRVEWNTLDEELFDRYVNYLRAQNYKQNFIQKTVTHFLTIIHHAKDKKLHENTVKYAMQKEKTKKIRLTPAEVEAMSTIDLSEWPDLKDEQERFQVAYGLLLRFGDSVRINEKNILKRDKKHFLSAFTQKSKQEILLPLSDRVYKILRWNGFQMKAANSTSNEKLKRIGMMAGVNSKITVTEFRNGKKIETVHKKYELIETHITRRSAARNLYDSGMDPLIIMTLGGWTNLKQLLEYIDIDLDYAATKAAGHAFFQ